jgi:hypothetical protein
MCQVKVLHPVQRLVSIPVDIAIYCKTCRYVSNSNSEPCGRCGGELVVRLVTLIHEPPNDPESGPASPGCVVPPVHLQLARAA